MLFDPFGGRFGRPGPLCNFGFPVLVLPIAGVGGQFSSPYFWSNVYVHDASLPVAALTGINSGSETCPTPTPRRCTLWLLLLVQASF